MRKTIQTFMAGMMLGANVMASVGMAQEQETVTWFHPDFPPFYLRYEDDARINGVGDEAMARLAKHDFSRHHQMVEGNYTRAFMEMKAGKHVCIAGVFKTPGREDYMEFTEPHLLILAPGIISTHQYDKILKRFVDEQGHIDLEAVVAAQHFRISYAGGRKFGPAIDHILHKYVPLQPELIQPRHNEVGISQPVDMLFRHHIDLIIGFSNTAAYHARNYSYANQITFYPIKGSPAVLPVYMGCAKGDWNDALMADLSHFITDLRLQPSYMAYYNQWIPANLRQWHEETSLDFFTSDGHGEDNSKTEGIHVAGS